jgi:hypothetical protein
LALLPTFTPHLYSQTEFSKGTGKITFLLVLDASPRLIMFGTVARATMRLAIMYLKLNILSLLWYLKYNDHNLSK